MNKLYITIKIWATSGNKAYSCNPLVGFAATIFTIKKPIDCGWITLLQTNLQVELTY
jgi:hypothetical protein